jgi:chemotaxis response regulator CheB
MSYRILVVDDLAIVPRILQTTLDSERDIEVVRVAPDPYVAWNKTIKLEPDVLTLDIEVPRMDRLAFLKRPKRYHCGRWRIERLREKSEFRSKESGPFPFHRQW